MAMKEYAVWRRQTPDRGPVSPWVLTKQRVKGRTREEADSKIRRRFKNAGFSGMQLLVLPTGDLPITVTMGLS